MRSRHGFTLIELLVVIAIIAVLVAILLPAVQQAREAARNSQCKNHIKQISIGLHNYHETHGVMPFATVTRWNGNNTLPGTAGTLQRQGWFHMLLPFVDQAPMYNAISPKIETNSFAGDWPESQRPIATFMCPSDPLNPKLTNQGFHGNYILCHGNSQGGGNNTYDVKEGMFYPLSKTKLTDVKDGTSNTAMVGELKLSRDGGPVTPGQSSCGAPHDIRGRYNNTQHAGTLFTTMRPPNTPIGDTMEYCQGTFDAPCRACVGGTSEVHTRSFHVGIVNLGMADGSIRAVSDHVDQALFAALGSINGRDKPLPE